MVGLYLFLPIRFLEGGEGEFLLIELLVGIVDGNDVVDTIVPSGDTTTRVGYGDYIIELLATVGGDCDLTPYRL